VTFHNWDGSLMPVSDGSADPVSTYWFSIPPKGSLVLKTDGKGAGCSGYAVVNTNHAIGGSAVFSQYDNSGVLITEAGVGSSPLMQFFAFPVDTTADLNAGFAIYNPGERAASLIIRLLDGSGHPLQSRSLTLPSGQQLAQYVAGVGQLFPTAYGIQGSLQVTADVPVAAIALRSSSATFTTLNPTSANQTFDPVSQVFPQIVAGNSPARYRSTMILMNPGYLAVTGTIQFTRSDGTPMPLTINGVTSAMHAFSVPALSTLFWEATAAGELEIGYAVLAANHSLGAMAVISQYDAAGSALQCEVGVTPAAAMSHFYLFAQTEGEFNTGMAVANPRSSGSAVSFDLRASDQVWHGDPLTLGAGAHRAEMISGPGQLFPSFAGFGSLEVTSTLPVPAMTLRLSGKTMTALPVIPDIN
jgi:hypothetical protein